MTRTLDPLRFEKAFDAWRRSALANVFLDAARSPRQRGHEPTPQMVLAAVEADVRNRLRWAERRYQEATDPELRDEHGETVGFWQGLLQELLYPDAELWDYIDLRIRWDKLPNNEQANIKRRSANSANGEITPLENRSVSEAQTQYLAALGYRGPAPENMARASELINQLKLAKGGHR